MAFLMAEVKKKTDAWELHNILTDFDPNKSNDSVYSESTDEKISKNNALGAAQGFQTALSLRKNQESQNNKGRCKLNCNLAISRTKLTKIFNY